MDHTGQTALHWCAVRGATKVAELLLQEGAQINAADMYGFQVNFTLFNLYLALHWIIICSIRIHGSLLLF